MGEAAKNVDAETASKPSPDQLFWIDQATYFAARADSASIRKWEWAAFGSVLLFIYLAFISPPWQALKAVDILVILLVVGVSAVLVAFEQRLEKESEALSRLSSNQIRLSDAGKEPSTATSQAARNDSAATTAGPAP